MREKLILALDINSLEKAEQVVGEVKEYVKFYKIGSRLFTAYGPSAVELVKKNGGKVFLDLKFHDIPNTVAAAVKEASDMGIDMLTVHAMGGREMLMAASEAARLAKGKRPLIVAVTLLTSLDQSYLDTMGINLTPDKFVMRLAGLADECGLDGVVASGMECRQIREKFGPDFKIVTPGIRLSDDKQDQKRTDTPAKTMKNGASYLVIGRPILEAGDKVQAVKKILNEMEK